MNDFKEKLNIITEKWLLEHILKEDMKYYLYERQKNFNNQNFTFEEELVDDEPEIFIYTCDCLSEKHKIPKEVHLKILNGAKYNCKVCKKMLKIAN